MKKIYKATILTIILFFFSSGYILGQNYKVIVNKSNSVTSLTKKDASDYFLKKKTRWIDKTSVRPVDLSSNSSVREGFSQSVHTKTVAQVRAYWQQSVFSGKASPPVELKTDADVINYVKNNKGAIGYVSSSANTSEVKVITIK